MKFSLVLPAAALAAAGIAASTAHGQAAPTTLSLFEPEQGATFTIADSPPRSPSANPERFRTSAGDRAFFSTRVLDRKGGATAGRVYHEVTVVKGSRFRSATFLTRVTLSLAGGQIVAEGAYGPGTSRTLAITGGTGRYAGARGTYTNTDAGADTLTLAP
jgi:hypothetical protein